MPAPPAKLDHPFAGYTITERIGTGGYGEVWKAEAPGGLTKAVKFVYGCLDGERAACELKALRRVKEVRHPFLLSLERIEVIDGQLVILTELAEASLKDRYNECRGEGLPGIPRDELLVCLHDAAEALDYMSEHYSLQHLDVKPENLLIVGGRVKVADFGLVKEIEDRTVSLLGGLTPVYASPELFDGRPSRHSDQYSLAIVYQEMLTGVPPFPGKTTAQLTSQHLYSRPRVGALPPADQPVIERALAKSPDERYPTCRAMIEALRAAQSPSPGLPEPSEPPMSGPPVRIDTIPAVQPSAGTAAEPEPSPCTASSWGGENPPTLHTLALDDVVSAARPAALAAADDRPQAAIDLPPIDLPAAQPRLRPTLFVGIGGTAARILVRLRRRLGHRLGDLSAITSLELLLLDTDAGALEWAVRGNEADGLRPRQTLAMPLRRPQDYREASDRLLRWMSRRWLFNIPRSLQTEGIRPLGRLAFVDHCEELFRRLRAALEAVASPDSLAASAAATGIGKTDPRPRVCLVASICGGTGSGMVLDVAYAARKVLAELGLSDDGVEGTLVYSTVRNPSAKDLATANACACLRELSHFRRTGRYPGDPACGLPALENDPGPFREMYLAHLGDNLNEEQFDAAADAVAERLYLDALTAAGRFFETFRRPAGTDGKVRPPALRTFAVARFGCSHDPGAEAAADALCARLLRRWCGQARGPGGADGQTVPPLPLPARLEPLLGRADAAIERELGGPAASAFSTIVGRSGPGKAAPGELLEHIDRLVGDREPAAEAGKPAAGRVQAALVREFQDLAASLAAALGRAVLDAVDASPHRVEGARGAAQDAAERLRALEAEAEAAIHDLGARILPLEQGLLREEPAPRGNPLAWLGLRRGAARHAADDRWLEYFRARLQRASFRAVSGLLRALRAQATALRDRLTDARRMLLQLAERFEAGPPAGRRPGPAEPLLARLDDMARRLDREFQAFLRPRGGLRAVLERENDSLGPAGAALRQAARSVVFHTLREIDLPGMLALAPGSDQPIGPAARAWLDAAAPRLPACGGGRRMLLVVPAGGPADRLAETVERGAGLRPTVVCDAGPDLALCCEIGEISVSRAIDALLGDRRQCAEIAARLHTRIDISWSK